MTASIVIPTYDRPEKLRGTLKSVSDQSVDEYEVIVVDDGSKSAGQARVLDEFGRLEEFTVIQQTNSGPAAARNRGWRVATGDFVLFTDDDCIVPNDWVESLTSAFEEDVAVVGGDLLPKSDLLPTNPFARAHQLRDRLDYDAPTEITRGEHSLNVGGTANVAYRRSVLDQVGGFDESFPLAAGEDADLFKRVLDAGYDATFVPVTVRHNDDYTWETFVSRAIRFGEGTCHFHRKHGRERSPVRVGMGLLGSIIFFPKALARSWDLTASALYVTERVLSRWGELMCVLSRPD